MYVEAVCPLCFATHVVDDDMRGEKYRCDECEEIFIVSKKAKRTNKRPPRPREVQAADDMQDVVPVEEAEMLPEAKLVDPARAKKGRNDDDEVHEIPDEAVKSRSSRAKTAPAGRRNEDEDDRSRRRRRDEDDDDRPRRRSEARKSGPSMGLVVGISAGVVLFIGLLVGSIWWAVSPGKEKEQQAQSDQMATRRAAGGQDEAPPKKQVPGGEQKPADPLIEPPPANLPRKQPPKDTPPAHWTVKADPPAAPVRLPDKVKSDIPVPGRLAQIVFPTAPSPFVAIGVNTTPGDERQVWNLETGQTTGKVVGSIPTSRHPILSADGEHLAYLPSAKKGTVDVWAVRPGKVVSIDLGSGNDPEVIDFAGPGKLLIGQRNNDRMVFRRYDVATGKAEPEFDAPRPGAVPLDGVAISPGGAYLALVDREALWVYDLKTRVAVGERPLSKASAVRTCLGLSFSPDGSELAGLFATGAAQQLVCWDATRGDLISELSIPQAHPAPSVRNAYRGHAIDWIGERRGWLLYGYSMVSRNQNGTVTGLPQPPRVGAPVPRHMVGPGHVATLGPAAKVNESVLTVDPFDPDRPK